MHRRHRRNGEQRPTRLVQVDLARRRDGEEGPGGRRVRGGGIVGGGAVGDGEGDGRAVVDDEVAPYGCL